MRSFIRIENQFNSLLKKKMNEFRSNRDEIENLTTVNELWDHTQKIFKDMGPIVYYNIVLPLFAMMYNKMLTNQLGKSDVDIRNIDLSHIRPL